MQTKPASIDLKALAEDKKTQLQFNNGLDKKTVDKSTLAKEFSASGGKRVAPTPK